MLRIPKSFVENELSTVSGIFSISDVITAYSKASKGLGTIIG